MRIEFGGKGSIVARGDVWKSHCGTGHKFLLKLLSRSFSLLGLHTIVHIENIMCSFPKTNTCILKSGCWTKILYFMITNLQMMILKQGKSDLPMSIKVGQVGIVWIPNKTQCTLIASPTLWPGLGFIHSLPQWAAVGREVGSCPEELIMSDSSSGQVFLCCFPALCRVCVSMFW